MWALKIIYTIIFSTVVLHASFCEENYLTINKFVNNFNVTECNCDCTMQDNIIYIQSKKISGVFYKIESVSTLSEKKGKLSININPRMNYLLSNKKICNSKNSINTKKVALFIYSLIPSDSDYCYDLSAYFDNNEHLIILDSAVNYKKIVIIQIKKQPLYKSPNIKTKMYLIKGDKVEILEEKDGWLYILYHGKKDIKAWIPKSAVE